MDKNTLWAILLSTLVVVVSGIVEFTVIMPRQQQRMEALAAEEELKAKEAAALAEEQSKAISTSLGIEEDTGNEKETVAEEFVEITTNKMKAVFSNKGGDLVSLKLLEHLDKETGEGVEMVNHVTPSNRALSLSFGNAETSVLNDTFTISRINDYSVGFYRSYSIKDDMGNDHKFYLAKLYTFKDDDYAFKMDITVRPEDGYALNVGGAAYTIRTSPQIGPRFDKKNRYEVRQYVALGNNNKRVKKNFSDKYYDTSYQWAGVAGKYFTMLIKPVNPAVMYSSVKCSSPKGLEEDISQLLLTRAQTSGGSVTDEYYVYVGPRSENELIKYNSKDKNAWGLVNAKFNQALDSSSFLYPIEVVLKWAIGLINKLVHNWGVAIIILTIILKIILFPLNKKQAVGSLKMQELQPQMQAIQAKYKNDQQKLAEETQKLYKKVGYNPMSGCLPMILQMLILISLYRVFNNYFDFRGAGFIPGWIDDLSVGDSVWTWEKQIPLISGFTMNNLRILPFIYVISQLLNGKITQYGGTAGGDNAQAKQMQIMMMYVMPIMFFFIMYNVPSGLLIYWVVSNIFQIGQQLVINRVMKKQRAEMKNAQNVSVSGKKAKPRK